MRTYLTLIRGSKIPLIFNIKTMNRNQRKRRSKRSTPKNIRNKHAKDMKRVLKNIKSNVNAKSICLS